MIINLSRCLSDYKRYHYQIIIICYKPLSTCSNLKMISKISAAAALLLTLGETRRERNLNGSIQDSFGDQSDKQRKLRGRCDNITIEWAWIERERWADFHIYQSKVVCHRGGKKKSTSYPPVLAEYNAYDIEDVTWVYAEPRKGTRCEGDHLCADYLKWKGSPVTLRGEKVSKFAGGIENRTHCRDMLDWDGDASLKVWYWSAHLQDWTAYCYKARRSNGVI